jgi:hypothetical protein
MVVRTTDRIRVSEEQLAEALSIFERALADLGLVADIEVADDWDPESSEVPDRTVLVARVRQEVDVRRLTDALPVIGDRLRERRLMSPSLPLVFHLLPWW